MKRLLIHVGLPKAGSTTLQAVFGHSGMASYLGRREAEYPDPFIGEFTRAIAPLSDARTLDCTRYRDAFSAAFQNSRHETFVLSDEILSSVGFHAQGRCNSLPQTMDNFKHVVNIPLEVMIVIRAQWPYMRSYFKQWIAVGGDTTYEDFMQLVLMRPDHYLMRALDYYNFVGSVRPLVQKVHIVVFERFFHEAAYRLQKLEEIGLADLFAPLQNLHERPAQSESAIARLLASREPTVWSVPDQMKSQRTYADIYVNRILKTDKAMGIWERCQRLRAKHKAYAVGAPPPPRPYFSPTDNLFEMEPETEAAMDTYFRKVNSRLGELDGDTDWGAHGYIS